MIEPLTAPPIEIACRAIEFLPVDRQIAPGLERRLGYFGQDRFVGFCYEPRGDEVMWYDSRSYGFGTGAWATFLDEIWPLADEYRVQVGSSKLRAEHVLIIDREKRVAFFARRALAEQFLADQGRPVQ